MRTHVSRTLSSCFAVLRQLCSIRRSVSPAVLQLLVVSLVLSCLDYGNAALAGLAGNQLDRLQSVINGASRLVCFVRKYEHITPLIRDLHWLPVCDRIEFKLAVLVFRCLHGAVPGEWAVSCGTHRRKKLHSALYTTLHSASTSALIKPSSRRSTIGDRAFFVAAPRVWNSLPSSVTASQTLGAFRRRVKTHLFTVSLT